MAYIINESDADLICKHHFVTHYPNLIRKHGPLIHLWMMRFECMHKVFTDKIRQTQNFVNITKSLAESYQTDICMKSKKYEIDIVASQKKYDVRKLTDFCDYKLELENCFQSKIPQALQFVSYGSFQFRKGLMVIDEGTVFEIAHVLQEDSQFYIVCFSYKFLQFDETLNSIEIQQTARKIYHLLNLNKLKNKKTYDKTFCAKKIYIIADTLDVIL